MCVARRDGRAEVCVTAAEVCVTAAEVCVAAEHDGILPKKTIIDHEFHL